MIFAINVENVEMVLLADGWHFIKEHSFEINTYGYAYEGEPIHGGATGFEFVEAVEQLDADVRTAGPLTSIMAVRVQG